MMPIFHQEVLVGFSSILTGLNFIATTHKMRAPGLTWFRLPLFVWANYATGVIMMLGTPVIAPGPGFHVAFAAPSRAAVPDRRRMHGASPSAPARQWRR